MKLTGDLSLSQLFLSVKSKTFRDDLQLSWIQYVNIGFQFAYVFFQHHAFYDAFIFRTGNRIDQGYLTSVVVRSDRVV